MDSKGNKTFSPYERSRFDGSWPDDYEECLVEILLDHCLLGHLDQGIPSWIPHAVEAEMNKATGGQFSAKMVRDEIDDMHRRHDMFRNLATKKWYGWDHKTNGCNITPKNAAVWEEFKEGEKHFLKMHSWIFYGENKKKSAASSSVYARLDKNTSSGVGTKPLNADAPTQWSTNKYQGRYFAPRRNKAIALSHDPIIIQSSSNSYAVEKSKEESNSVNQTYALSEDSQEF